MGPHLHGAGRRLPGDGTSTYTTAYDYGTPFYSRAEREFFGFNKVMETRNDGSAVERTFENHDYHKKGLQYTEILRDKPGHVWSRTENTYETPRPGRPNVPALFPDQNYDDSHKDQLHVKFPMLTATTRHFYTGKTTDPAVSSKSTAQNFEYDDYGNINLFVDRADEGTTDDVYATIAYWTDPQDNYIVGKPETIRVTDNSRSNVFRERKAVYQNGTGNMTELSMLIQGSTNAVEHRVRSDTGTCEDHLSRRRPEPQHEKPTGTSSPISTTPRSRPTSPASATPSATAPSRLQVRVRPAQLDQRHQRQLPGQ